jgi:hypothetical protein
LSPPVEAASGALRHAVHEIDVHAALALDQAACATCSTI